MTYRVSKMFGIEPVTAMTSYSNFGSSDSPTSEKVRDAVTILHKAYPEMVVDGEIQSDFALNSKMLQDIFPFSKLAGRKVNTLIFPNLDAANISYKLLKELNKAESIGPIMMGMAKPVHILQLDASVDEIVNMTAISVIDAQEREKKHQK
jgi:malate dehydrogenase (oxaloacetate-decarboxylating)(NADP+)